MRQARVGAMVLALLGAGACTVDGGIADPGAPAPPREVDASYHAGVVTVTWELDPRWDGESFRVYGRRSSEGDYRRIAEVTSCAADRCSYADANVQTGRSYDYYVSAVGRSGAETASAGSVRVDVPQPTPPPVPTGVAAVALDGAIYVRWSDVARGAADFSFYRVYLQGSNGSHILGETDSEGFLDLLAENGKTYVYSVSAVDVDGHESARSGSVRATPRPDYTAEWIRDWLENPSTSGFRFAASETENPIVSGSDPSRHFRLEADAEGWWLVPGPSVEVYPSAWSTTALKCGPAADADCADVSRAPTGGYVHEALGLEPQSSYVLRVRGGDGAVRYGMIRVSLLGSDQNGDALMVFDWAYQLQAGNPDLAPRPAPIR